LQEFLNLTEKKWLFIWVDDTWQFWHRSVISNASIFWHRARHLRTLKKIKIFGRQFSSKDNLARDGVANAECKIAKMYNNGPEIIVSDSRSIFFITSSVGMVLLYLLTVIVREETLGCQEKKLSNRGRGISLLVQNDH
jgi:hypothetical protein